MKGNITKAISVYLYPFYNALFPKFYNILIDWIYSICDNNYDFMRLFMNHSTLCLNRICFVTFFHSYGQQLQFGRERTFYLIDKAEAFLQNILLKQNNSTEMYIKNLGQFF